MCIWLWFIFSCRQTDWMGRSDCPGCVCVTWAWLVHSKEHATVVFCGCHLCLCTSVFKITEALFAFSQAVWVCTMVSISLPFLCYINIIHWVLRGMVLGAVEGMTAFMQLTLAPVGGLFMQEGSKWEGMHVHRRFSCADCVWCIFGRRGCGCTPRAEVCQAWETRLHCPFLLHAPSTYCPGFISSCLSARPHTMVDGCLATGTLLSENQDRMQQEFSPWQIREKQCCPPAQLILIRCHSLQGQKRRRAPLQSWWVRRYELR